MSTDTRNTDEKAADDLLAQHVEKMQQPNSEPLPGDFNPFDELPSPIAFMLDKVQAMDANRAAQQRRGELVTLVAALLAGNHCNPSNPHTVANTALDLLEAVDLAMVSRAVDKAVQS